MTNQTYVTKKEKVRDFIEYNFFPIGEQDPVFAVPRSDLEITCFRKYGADKKIVDAVLEFYQKAGLLVVTDKKVEKKLSKSFQEMNKNEIQPEQKQNTHNHQP